MLIKVLVYIISMSITGCYVFCVSGKHAFGIYSSVLFLVKIPLPQYRWLMLFIILCLVISFFKVIGLIPGHCLLMLLKQYKNNIVRIKRGFDSSKPTKVYKGSHQRGLYQSLPNANSNGISYIQNLAIRTVLTNVCIIVSTFRTKYAGDMEKAQARLLNAGLGLNKF